MSERVGRILLISGPVGSGKTRHLEALVSQALARGQSVAGVLSHYAMETGRRAGLEIRDLGTGQDRILARPRATSDPDGGPFDRARWRFDPVALDWAARALAASPPVDLLVIDELGPLEFDHGLGLSSAFERLARRDYELAAVTIRHTRLKHALSRWPEADVLEVTGSTSADPAAAHPSRS